MLPLAFAGIALLVLTSYVVRSFLVPPKIPCIPSDFLATYIWPWGNLGDLGVHNILTGGDVFTWLSLRCVKHKSPLVQVFLPSFSTTHPTLVLSDITEIKEIVTRRIGEIDRASMMSSFFGLLVPKSTICMKTDRTFKRTRRVWNSLLSPGFRQDVAASAFYEATQELIQLWKGKSQAVGADLAFEATQDLRRTALEGIWRLLTGKRLGVLQAELEHARHRPVEPSWLGSLFGGCSASFGPAKYPRVYTALNDMLFALDWVTQGVSPVVYTWIFRRLQSLPRAETDVQEFLEREIGIQRARLMSRGGEQQRDLHDCGLQRVMSHEEPAGLDAEGLRHEVLEMMIAGHETMASTIGWSLKHLADSPNVQARLQDSLRNAFPDAMLGRLPDASQIVAADVPYLDAFLAEALRLPCTVPMSFRETVQDCCILGRHVPKGTPIVLLTAGPFYDKWPAFTEGRNALPKAVDVSRDANRASKSEMEVPRCVFAPERWLTSDGAFDANAVSSLPFFAGPRGCFGKSLAHLEMKIMITLLCLSFKFPKLDRSLSSYAHYDGLTRRPKTCYVRPCVIR